MAALQTCILPRQGVSKECNRLGRFGSDQLLDKVIDKLGDVVLSEILDVSRVGGHSEEMYTLDSHRKATREFQPCHSGRYPHPPKQGLCSFPDGHGAS